MRCKISVNSPVLTQFYNIFEHETNTRRQVHVLRQYFHPFEILAHQLLPFVCVQNAATGTQDLTEALEVLGHILSGVAVLLLVQQQLLDAPVQDAFRQYLQLGQLPDELDVAEHLSLGQLPPLLLLGRVAVAVKQLAVLRPVLELRPTYVEQQQAERARHVLRLKVGGFARQPLAQLRVH